MNSQKNLHHRYITITFFFFIATFFQSLQAMELTSPSWGYSLDLPEGYVLVQGNNFDRFHFTHSLFPVDLQIALYPKEQFAKSIEALHWVTQQLQSTGDEISFEWRTRDAAIGHIQNSQTGGWCISVELPEDKGFLVMAVFTGINRAVELEPLLISTLDALYTDNQSRFSSGPMTSFAWPKEGTLSNQITIKNKSASLLFDAIDAQANQSVIDREFSVLTSYLETDMIYPAWQRYYRMIYRDAWSRIEKASFALSSILSEDSTLLSEELLAWTQSFTYERNFSGSDFTNLPDAFASQRGDCDSRALLMISLLHQRGIDAILLVSPEYSHALIGIDCPGEGARFAVGDKKYLLGDTTAKVKLGLIPQDMADSSKWFAVVFPAFD